MTSCARGSNPFFFFFKNSHRHFWVPDWSSIESIDLHQGFTVNVAALMGVWQTKPLPPPGSVVSCVCLGTGCCQKACGGHSGHVSLGSLSERLGMGRGGSRMASPLRKEKHRIGVSDKGLQGNKCTSDSGVQRIWATVV